MSMGIFVKKRFVGENALSGSLATELGNLRQLQTL